MSQDESKSDNDSDQSFENVNKCSKKWSEMPVTVFASTSQQIERKGSVKRKVFKSSVDSSDQETNSSEESESRVADLTNGSQIHQEPFINKELSKSKSVRLIFICR